MPSKKLRLIHTSDTHLGDATGHPESADALTAVVNTVSDNGGDMLLLVGDVFANERVSDDVLEWFLDEMGRLQTPAVLMNATRNKRSAKRSLLAPILARTLLPPPPAAAIHWLMNAVECGRAWEPLVR